MSGFVLASMLFMHVVDDYYLQGILANLKQRSYWEERHLLPLTGRLVFDVAGRSLVEICLAQVVEKPANRYRLFLRF